MSGSVSTGGCLCGAIELQVIGESENVSYCHCGDCRKATGAPVSILAAYPRDLVTIERGVPGTYESSPGVRRSFCRECGTSLSYEDERLPGEVYLHAGIFDNPELFRPGLHGWDSRRLRWLRISDDLPRYEDSSKPR